MMQQAKRKLVLEQVRLAFFWRYLGVPKAHAGTKCVQPPPCFRHDSNTFDARHQAVRSGRAAFVQIRRSHSQADSHLQRWSCIS